jgi:hypothetical protein
LPKYPTAISKHRAYNSKDNEPLHSANLKLKEDNVKLFTECIRLRKRCEIIEKELGKS